VLEFNIIVGIVLFVELRVLHRSVSLEWRVMFTGSEKK